MRGGGNEILSKKNEFTGGGGTGKGVLKGGENKNETSTSFQISDSFYFSI